MLPMNINKECAQIGFKLSDIAYQNILFIQKKIVIFLVLPKISCLWYLVK